MFSIKATNSYGNSITYGLNNYNVAVISVTGLNPPEANISTAPIATKDGSVFTNAQVQNRNIVITFGITGRNPETARTSIYYYFKIKEPIQLEIQTKSRKATIGGYVESITADPFNIKQRIQVSIVCPDPYFLGDPLTLYGAASVNVVPLSDTKHGAIFEIRATGAAKGFVIANSATGQSFEIDDGLELAAGDVLTLDTRQGMKALTLTRSGTTTSVLQYMNQTYHDWIELLPIANNGISLAAGTGQANVSIYVTYQTHYEGI